MWLLQWAGSLRADFPPWHFTPLYSDTSSHFILNKYLRSLVSKIYSISFAWRSLVPTICSVPFALRHWGSPAALIKVKFQMSWIDLGWERINMYLKQYNVSVSYRMPTYRLHINVKDFSLLFILSNGQPSLNPPELQHYCSVLKWLKTSFMALQL